ncbi:MAG: N-acetyl-gamma-glutamyl-phosphate reductase [Micavibrio sp.]|nr:MAG: N-acetyl-gamma-glutamyl-phosphate reductase [Micavibrio sp.]
MQPEESKKLKASIIGITGYTGLELLRLLLAHPDVDIGYLTSRQHKNTPIGDVYPHLAHLGFRITDTDLQEIATNSDIVFICLPHKTAQVAVAELIGKTKIIDLSADYRLDDAETYTKYYGVPHAHPELLDKVVYGMPEINAEDVKSAETVANPGCFALLSQLMLYPFRGQIEHADIMAVTGSSGAGKTPGDGTHHPIRNHNMKSYNINAHRHIPEIIRTAGITEEQLNFVPTSGPFTRGIFAQAFLTLKENYDQNAIDTLIENTYGFCPFVRVQKEVSLSNIVSSNYIDLSYGGGNQGIIMIQGALDNLVKGAGGTAVQNMNLMFGLDETAGLGNLGPVYP